MNFAYVLVSDSTDIYYEQFLVSLISLKHWNPDSNVFVACDNATKGTLTGLRSRHLKYVNEVKVVDFEEDKSKHYRSRFLKTTLRKLFSGDFLYLDSDTIVCDKIEESEFMGDVMGVDDKHQLPQNHSMWPEISRDINGAGFSADNLVHYINSGVLWMKDCKIVHELLSLWHQLWLNSEKRGISVDQPSLNEANKRMGGIIGCLSGEYNCQVSATLKYLYKAKIIHCFATMVSEASSKECAYLFLNKDFYYEMKDREITSLDEDRIFDAKSAFDGGETILLGKKDSDTYRSLVRTNLYGFIYCLFNSKRGRWLFDFMDKVVGAITSALWKNENF